MSILHVDLNSFYANCAVTASAGRYDFNTPLMVCGDPKQRHGIVLAATYPVKRLGVHAGLPVNRALELCPAAVVVEPDFRLYMRYSDEFMRIIKNYSPLIMRYGIDEAYVDYKGCEHIFGAPAAAADQIRERVKREIGLTVSVGVGENPIQAKMGSDYRKPDAVTVIDSKRWRELIWPMPVGNLMYIGKATEKKLRLYGVFTIGELAHMSPQLLRSCFGVIGEEMWQHANGLDDTRITYEAEIQKGIGNSCTLQKDAVNYGEVLSALLIQVDKVAFRLRSACMRAGMASVSLRYSDLSWESRQSALPVRTDLTDDIAHSAEQLLAALYKGGKPVRAVGLSVGKLTREAEQLSFLASPRRESARRLDSASDTLKRKYGQSALVRASSLPFDREDHGEFIPFCRH